MMQNSVRQTVDQLQGWLVNEGYSEGYLSHFRSTTKQLLRFIESENLSAFNTEVGFRFLEKRYNYTPQTRVGSANNSRVRMMQMLSEFQLHGTPMRKSRTRAYKLPEGFREATEGFIENRRFTGIVEGNMGTISLYLERFFNYITAKGVSTANQISLEHIHGFLISLAGYSNSTKDHTMRTVRQFMAYCFKNGFCPKNLSEQVPAVHYEKRSRIPSAYSGEEIARLLSMVDRSNPVGRRNYAILLLITRLGLRAGDTASLKFENIFWEENRISLTQHKTGRSLTLPLPEDVGLAIIDYLKYGRPICDSKAIFVRHRAPLDEYSAGGIYSMVSGYIAKAGIHAEGKRRGPHALRHSLASRLLEENVPLPVISEILGHANSDTTAVYLSISIDKLRRCALEV